MNPELMFVGMASRVFLISDYEHWLLNYVYTLLAWLTDASTVM